MVMPERVRVVVSGAGPAGMLAAINMLRRNHAGATVEYEVHLVDPGEDYGMLTPAGLEKKRSWMIGLSAHGITALKRVPKLFDEYVRAVGVPVTKNAIYIGATKLTSSIGENEVLLVDRNFVVAAMARFLNDHFKASGLLHLHYTHRLLYVDPDVRRVCVRSAAGSDSFLPYDLLLGCDGIRSNVRAALIRDHREFCCSIQDIFSFFKSVHIPLPKGVEGDAVHVTPEGVKGMNGIGLPETGGKINFAMGYYIDQVSTVACASGGWLSCGQRERPACTASCAPDPRSRPARPCRTRLPAPGQPPDEALLGTDAEAVAAYLRKAFKAFPLPYEDFARQWVAQSWSTTGQVRASAAKSRAGAGASCVRAPAGSALCSRTCAAAARPRCVRLCRRCTALFTTRCRSSCCCWATPRMPRHPPSARA